MKVTLTEEEFAVLKKINAGVLGNLPEFSHPVPFQVTEDDLTADEYLVAEMLADFGMVEKLDTGYIAQSVIPSDFNHRREITVDATTDVYGDQIYLAKLEKKIP